MLRDPYSAKPYVLFYTTKRVGGGVQNFDAIKLLKFAAVVSARPNAPARLPLPRPRRGTSFHPRTSTMTSTLIAGPGEEPVTLAEAKAWCRIDASDEDALVTALIAAARLQVESLTGRALVTQSWRLTLDCPRGRLVVLPVVPVRVATAIAMATRSASRAAGRRGAAGRARATAARRSTTPPATATAADVPADLKQAVLALVAYWYENRDLRWRRRRPGFDRLLARLQAGAAVSETDPADRHADRPRAAASAASRPTRTRAARSRCSRRSPRCGRGCGR